MGASKKASNLKKSEIDEWNCLNGVESQRSVMAYVTDTAAPAPTTFPCITIGIAQQQITANMNSRAGFLALSRGNHRNGQYQDDNNIVYQINLPGQVVGHQQQLTFNRVW